jgi:hypothetical protein
MLTASLRRHLGCTQLNTYTVLYNIVTLSAEIVTCLLSPPLSLWDQMGLPIKVHIYSVNIYSSWKCHVSLVSESCGCVASVWWLEIWMQYCLWKQNDLSKTKVFYAMFDCNQLEQGWTWTHVPAQAAVNG